MSCQGICKSGEKCKKKAASGFCMQHEEQDNSSWIANANLDDVVRDILERNNFLTTLLETRREEIMNYPLLSESDLYQIERWTLQLESISEKVITLQRCRDFNELTMKLRSLANPMFDVGNSLGDMGSWFNFIEVWDERNPFDLDSLADEYNIWSLMQTDQQLKRESRFFGHYPDIGALEEVYIFLPYFIRKVEKVHQELRVLRDVKGKVAKLRKFLEKCSKRLNSSDKAKLGKLELKLR